MGVEVFEAFESLPFELGGDDGDAALFVVFLELLLGGGYVAGVCRGEGIGVEEAAGPGSPSLG